MTADRMHAIKLRGFTVPNYVVAEMPARPRQQAPSFPLSELEAETLARLCDEFRAAVFEKAGKVDPRP